MAWISLALRKQSLKADINELTNYDIQLSRKKRQVHRHLSYEQSANKSAKTAELRAIKEPYMALRKMRPDTKSENYQDWQNAYNDAKEDYQAQKADIEDYYDELNEELETEAQDEEDQIDEEITQTETQRDAMNAELQALQDQIKTEIQSSAIKF